MRYTYQVTIIKSLIACMLLISINTLKINIWSTCTYTYYYEMLQDDDYFMALAVLASKRSPDPNTKVGACILDKNKNVGALGFNRFPRGCQNFPWSREGEMLETKYAYSK